MDPELMRPSTPPAASVLISTMSGSVSFGFEVSNVKTRTWPLPHSCVRFSQDSLVMDAISLAYRILLPSIDYRVHDPSMRDHYAVSSRATPETVRLVTCNWAWNRD